MNETNIVSISGGKDSQATVLLAIEREVPNLQCVFADTGHEHELTYEFVDYLESQISIPIRRVRASFDDKIANKRQFIKTHWYEDLYERFRSGGKISHEEAAYQAQMRVREALNVLRPTGNAFLDLCLWKGRFPSTRRRFCSEELKHKPMDREVFQPAVEQFERVVSWQGVRADESTSRGKLLDAPYGGVWEAEFGSGDPEAAPGLWIYRPILTWTAEQCFALIKRHGLRWNPLYEMGMSRVGCMPCIHAGKREIREIARRFPAEVERVAEWEAIVSDATKGGVSVFMDARVTERYLSAIGSPEKSLLGKVRAQNIHPETHGIHTYVDWAMTSRGGRQIDLIAAIDATEEAPMCSSVYGLCE